MNNKYSIKRKLGSGSFGDVYLVIDKITKLDYAMKVEYLNASKPQLLSEAKIYQNLTGSIGFPKLQGFEKTNEAYLLVTEVIGPNLEEIFDKKNRQFSLEIISNLFIQMIERIQTFHEKGYIHRDLKPENFLFKNGTLYLIDYGLSKKYKINNQHIPFSDGHSLIGTPRYASKFTHLGYEGSRRDDLESIGYIIVYLIKGNLPWQGIVSKNKKEKYAKILKVKQDTDITKFCKEPSYIKKYFEYINSLYFEDTPNYSYIKTLINNQQIVDLDKEFDI